MKDVEYAIKVLNSKVYGLRDAMVDNATVYKKFVKEVHDNFDILRKRITRVERREQMDRLAIYVVIYKLWKVNKNLQEVDEKCSVKLKKKAEKTGVNETKTGAVEVGDIVFEG